MTTATQLATQTSPCRNGCGRHVHYGTNPANGYEGRGGVALRAWTLIGSVLDGDATWIEHVIYPDGTCGNVL